MVKECFRINTRLLGESAPLGANLLRFQDLPEGQMLFTRWKYDISSFNHRGLPNKLSKINSGTFLTIHGHKQKQSTGNVKCRKTVKL